jgi:hypothetical protein
MLPPFRVETATALILGETQKKSMTAVEEQTMSHLQSWAVPSGSSMRAAPTGTPFFQHTDILDMHVNFG